MEIAVLNLDDGYRVYYHCRSFLVLYIIVYTVCTARVDVDLYH